MTWWAVSFGPFAEDVSFCVTSEYTPPQDAARARSLFADGRKRVLLVTEVRTLNPSS
jgi:hypothetical protein